MGGHEDVIDLINVDVEWSRDDDAVDVVDKDADNAHEEEEIEEEIEEDCEEAFGFDRSS